MSSLRAGPELPPHLLAKRKRQAEHTPTAPQSLDVASPKANSRPSSPDSASKKRRIAGPAPPPAPLDERPPGNPDGGSESSDEDDFGPAPARPGRSALRRNDPLNTTLPVKTDQAHGKSTRRDDWMTMPPKQDDLAARMDPTKIRSKGFNTAKGAKGPGQAEGDNAIWTETPEQKRKRLENEILGISQTSSERPEDFKDKKQRRDDEEKARQIREHNESHRSKTLYEQHQGSTRKLKEDDPTKRAFNYEKDMAVTSKIGHAQRKDLLNKSADFSSKFSSGNYL